MPLQEKRIMDLRMEFVVLASQEGANMRELCRRYGISPTTGYRYLARWRALGAEGLQDRSRRPHASPAQTPPAMEAWWLRLGIAVSHGRPHHPQTQGKLERLHRTLWAEVVGIRDLPDLATAQTRFDVWRELYNHHRPHAALDYAVPSSRYQPSPRPFPDPLPPIVYGPDDAVRQVSHPGRISFANREYFIGHGLIGLPVAVRPTTTDGRFTVWYCQRQVATIDLSDPR